MATDADALNSVAKEIKAAAHDGYLHLLALIEAGNDPRSAVNAVFATFRGSLASQMAKAFSTVLETSIGTAEILEYKVGTVSLSSRLYQEAETTSKVVQQIVKTHTSALHNARQLALDIYEGYGFKADDPLVALKEMPRLPKYMRDAISVDPEFYRAYFDKAVNMASSIKTPPLRAAYMEALEAFEKKSKYLERKLKVAFEERMRYFATRIAQTEIHRAWIDKEADKIMADDTVEVVQVKLSGNHPRIDICDIYAKQDKYGLGPGLYPKALAPKPTYHPFCRCRFVTKRLIDASRAKLDQESEKRYLQSIADNDMALAAQIAGSRAKLNDVVSGKSFSAVVNKGVPKPYRLTSMSGKAL